MTYIKLIFLFVQILNFTFCYGEESLEKNDKLLNGFIDYYNNLPNRIYTCEGGTLDNTEKVDENSYRIQVTLQVAYISNLESKKHLKCSCIIQDLQDSGVVVLNNDYTCQEQSQIKDDERVPVDSTPVQLDNEVQTDTAITSGEQFVAIPREESTVSCVGCAVHIDPQAAGVTDLASLGIRHLEKHESNVKHSLKSVVDVERQVQVVNGVRYILTLLVNYNNCSDELSELCNFVKPCKISVLEKPWIRLSNGRKYRAVVANNCTEQWLFDDNGEILDVDLHDNRDSNEIDTNQNINNNAGDDNIKVIHTEDVLSQQNKEKALTDEQIKNIEQQIIPHKELAQSGTADKEEFDYLSKNNEEYFVKEVIKPDENSKSCTNKNEPLPLSENKKKAIDDFINFFNLYSNPSKEQVEKIPRLKRSYDLDLQAMPLGKTFQNLQNSLNYQKHSHNQYDSMNGGENSVKRLGEKKEQDVNDPKYKRLAEESLQKYLHNSGITIPHKVIRVVKVERKIVAGALIYINFTVASTIQSSGDLIHCYSEIWEQPMLKEKKITVNCKENLVEQTRGKRATRMKGTQSTRENPTNSEFKLLAQEALREYGRLKKNKFAYKVVEVKQVVSRLVSGTIYNIGFTAALTTCSRTMYDVTLCKKRANSSLIYCSAHIWSKPWMKTKEITVSCNTPKVKRPTFIRKLLVRNLSMNEIHKASNKEFQKPYNYSYKLDHFDKEPSTRHKRSIPFTAENATADFIEIQKLVQQSLEKLEMSSMHRYKQRVSLINSYSTKITTSKVTTIDFDVGYTSCLKYEWVDDVTACGFLENLPKRHCVSQIFERLWLQNGKHIEVHCEDETLLASHNEFESADMAMELAKESLKHIEAKYPNPRKQKVVRIFSLDKQVIAGVHYRMKIEVGSTNCWALSAETNCKLEKEEGINKFCRVNVWLRPSTDHPPNFRVTCDYQDSNTSDFYHNVQAERLFYNFISTYGPDYVNDQNEMRKRFNIFKDNVRRIHELNTHERGTATYGITSFADLSYDEFSARHMGLKPSLRNYNQGPMRKAEIPKSDIPEKFDWRDSNTVTEVKDQGSCGSCWAFSVTGNIEGQWKLKTGDLVSLSEQELVDCDELDQGCNGGLPDNAYRAIEQLGGLEKESDYPYEGADDKCVFNKTLSKVQITGAVNISSNETDMAKWLVHNGPISIGINANAMQFYMGGISHPWRMLCNPTNLDHGVLLVGYGIKDYPLFHKRLPFWTIKNSWGKSWGEQGYYRVYRGDGTCGVNQMASSAIL